MLPIKRLGVELNIVHFRFKQVMTECFRRHGLTITPEQFLVLDALWNEGSMSQQRLADIISKDKNSVTKLVDGLEKRGLIVRTPCKSDRRVNIVELTERATGIKDEASRTAVNCVMSLLQGIDEEELQKVIDVFDRINRNIEQMENKKDCHGKTLR